jgi:ferrochelatase
MTEPYDAILVLSFGGPEGMADVMPFLENVLRGRNVPRERMLEVAGHYAQFGGVSPINSQNRALIAALEAELAAHGPVLPVYWGNRNWHPLLPDTLRQMSADGVRRALAFVTSAFSSYSGCRQYREDIARAQLEVGPSAPAVDKLRAFYNHPGFIAAHTDHVQAALDSLPAARRPMARLAFTAHSVPLAMAAGSDYEAQLREAAGLVANSVGWPEWTLAYQSRSGPPSQPWLEPDVLAHLDALQAAGATDVVLVPIGFVSDHLEVRYDLDVEAQERGVALGLNVVRSATPGTHPAYIAMIRELVLERLEPERPRRALGTHGPRPDVCPESCCLVTGSSRPEPVTATPTSRRTADTGPGA